MQSLNVCNLSTYQAFGFPFSIEDEESIDIVTGTMARDNIDFSEPLNYSAISEMPSLIYKVSKKYFNSLV